MTINVQAFQKNGIKSDKLEEEFEFCCWNRLKNWLNSFPTVYNCGCENEVPSSDDRSNS